MNRRTELAGEIRDAYKFKKIVIVHSRMGLASDAMGAKFQEKLKSACERLEIELRLGEKVTNLDDIVANKCKRQTLKLRCTAVYVAHQICSRKKMLESLSKSSHIWRRR